MTRIASLSSAASRAARPSPRPRPATVSALLLGAVTILGGCAMPDSSNPTLEITRASVSAEQAALGLKIDNASDMDVRIETIDWSLVHGPLPVAEGSWALGVDIPSKGSHQFSRTVAFSSPSLDPTAGEVELTGRMDLQTIGNSSDMALEEAGFVSRHPVQRR